MKYKKETEFNMVKFLRFRLYNPRTTNRTYMTYKSIAKFLNKSESYVQKLCGKMVLPDNQINSSSS